MCADDFEIIKVIGIGGYSKVVMARKKDSGRLYAIKIMNKTQLLSKISKRTIVSEIEINKKIGKHDFIVPLHWSFQSEEELFLVMDLCVGG